MNQAYWNILDEPSVPARDQTHYRIIAKAAPFYQAQGGLRPNGIPIIVSGVAAAREKGQEWFEDCVCRRDDRAEFLRANLLHRRSVTKRQFYSNLRERTIELARESGQEWVDMDVKKSESSRAATALAERKKQDAITPAEKEAMEELARYDEWMYQRTQKMRTTLDMELFLEQQGIKRQTGGR
jgi:hypothetical protein